MQPGGPLVTRWFDGQHPRARSVRLRIEGDELLMHTGDEVRRYPLKDVRWPERRSHGQRQTDLPDGGMVQHADAAEWDAWWLAQGLAESRVVGWMQSWRATLASMAGTVVFLAVAWVWGVPWLSQTVAHAIPQKLEAHIGDQSMAQMESLFLEPSELPESQQADLRRRFETVVQRAYPAGDAPAWQLSFHKSEMLGANAFALPGGYIVMTDELVELLNDQPDAIVGVLAHELGHVQHRDGLDMLVRARGPMRTRRKCCTLQGFHRR
ncbi:MAG: M48 family metallopeptidase [Hydrogenophaga sp.]|nr:M48 family metallopeptidase [Hydrogenophaga sp.]